AADSGLGILGRRHLQKCKRAVSGDPSQRIFGRHSTSRRPLASLRRSGGGPVGHAPPGAPYDANVTLIGESAGIPTGFSLESGPDKPLSSRLSPAGEPTRDRVDRKWRAFQ